MQTLQYFLKQLSFFTPKKLKKTPSKVAQKNLNPLFFLTALAAQTTQTEEFMFQNVAYRPTVYRTGVWAAYMSEAIWIFYVHCKPVPCNENRVFPVKIFSQGNPCNETGSLKEEEGFHVMKKGFSLWEKLHRENPVMALYWPCTRLQCSTFCSISKWTLKVKKSRFPVLVLKYSSYIAVFL